MLRLSTILLLSILLAAPTRLPGYARGKILDTSRLDESDMVTYRRLTRDDFKATTLVPEWREHASKIGAMICVHLTMGTRSATAGTPVLERGGVVRYENQVMKLSFRAVMNRRCAWWGPRDARLPEPYVLEHEQIHFALYELEARALNSRADEIAASVRAQEATSPADLAEAQRKMDKVLANAARRCLTRNDRFDADTSAAHDPEKQKEWLRLVESELAATTRYASAPSPTPTQGLRLPRAPE